MSSSANSLALASTTAAEVIHEVENKRLLVIKLNLIVESLEVKEGTAEKHVYAAGELLDKKIKDLKALLLDNPNDGPVKKALARHEAKLRAAYIPTKDELTAIRADLVTAKADLHAAEVDLQAAVQAKLEIRRQLLADYSSEESGDEESEARDDDSAVVKSTFKASVVDAPILARPLVGAAKAADTSLRASDFNGLNLRGNAISDRRLDETAGVNTLHHDSGCGCTLSIPGSTGIDDNGTLASVRSQPSRRGSTISFVGAADGTTLDTRQDSSGALVVQDFIAQGPSMGGVAPTFSPRGGDDPDSFLRPGIGNAVRRQAAVASYGNIMLPLNRPASTTAASPAARSAAQVPTTQTLTNARARGETAGSAATPVPLKEIFAGGEGYVSDSDSLTLICTTPGRTTTDMSLASVTRERGSVATDPRDRASRREYPCLIPNSDGTFRIIVERASKMNAEDDTEARLQAARGLRLAMRATLTITDFKRWDFRLISKDQWIMTDFGRHWQANAIAIVEGEGKHLSGKDLTAHHVKMLEKIKSNPTYKGSPLASLIRERCDSKWKHRIYGPDSNPLVVLDRPGRTDHGYYVRGTWTSSNEYGGRDYIFDANFATPGQRLMGYLGLLSGHGEFYRTLLKKKDYEKILR